MKYLYTNEALGLILDRDKDGVIDWEVCGFDRKQVAKAVMKNAQGEISTGEYVSVLPISDEIVFNKALGGLIASANTEEEFSKVIEEEEANAIIADIKEVRAAKKVNS